MRLNRWIILVTLILTACGQAAATVSDSAEKSAIDLPTPTEVAAPTVGEGAPVADETPMEEATPVAEESAPAANAPTATPNVAELAPKTEFLPEEPPPFGAQREFSTDFGKHTVPYSEILSGGPPKDGIPAIDEPKFVTVEEADAWLKPQEPVILLEIGDDARAYPLQILMWHEIVNDVLDGVPVTVTFCPLCNTAIAFERNFDGQVLDFGTSGRLRYSNLIMYDRQTETWWQQANGAGIAGEYAGRQLTFLPASIIGWADFKAAHPDGRVLSQDTGFRRDYGRNPYIGYDDVNRSPFLYDGPRTPDQLPAMARVLTVDLDNEAVAYPYDVLQEIHVANDIVAGTPVAVFWAPGTASALDGAGVAAGRDVGSLVAYSRELDEETLSFRFEDGKIVDEGTGSEWNVLGLSTSGPLAGAELAPVVSVNHFWFSWAAFKPDTRIYASN